MFGKIKLIRGASLAAMIAASGSSLADTASMNGPLISATPVAGPQLLMPRSNIAQPGHFGTHLRIVAPQGGLQATATSGPPQSGMLVETPASLACVYRLVPVASGCNPNVVTAVATGGSRAIALIGAYDYPQAAADLNHYIAQFGLAAADFTVIYGTGNPANGCVNGAKPPADTTGWNTEAAVDIQMAHAMAPGAKLYLVEAASSSFADMHNALAVATTCVQAAGGGEISMSYGAPEFPGETANDSLYTAANVAYFASAGDTPGVQYPSASPNVFAVGGTSIIRDQTTGAFESEIAWNYPFPFISGMARMGTGGGTSAYEPRPSYQDGIAAIVGSGRGTPDLAAVADVFLGGAWFYSSSIPNGWVIAGGTSVASPLVAAIVNRAGFFWSSSRAGHDNIYNLAAQNTLKNYVTDINSGVCGPQGTFMSLMGTGSGYDPAWIEAKTGISWDPCTGWGTPHGSH
jgi:kumamolisin